MLEEVKEIIKFFAGTSVVAAAIVYVGKAFFDTFIATRLEKTKKQIEIHSQSETRKRDEIKKWTNPILSSVNGLTGRLNHLLYEKEDSALDSYYISSSLYYFAQYLCWIQILKEEINYEIFNEEKEEHAFFDSIKKVNISFRNNTLTPIYSLQQRLIAEMMMCENNGQRTCMNYYDFLKNIENDHAKEILKPLDELISKIPVDETNKVKLEITLNELKNLQTQCTKILKNGPNLCMRVKNLPIKLWGHIKACYKAILQ